MITDVNGFACMHARSKKHFEISCFVVGVDLRFSPWLAIAQVELVSDD